MSINRWKCDVLWTQNNEEFCSQNHLLVIFSTVYELQRHLVALLRYSGLVLGLISAPRLVLIHNYNIWGWRESAQLYEENISTMLVLLPDVHWFFMFCCLLNTGLEPAGADPGSDPGSGPGSGLSPTRGGTRGNRGQDLLLLYKGSLRSGWNPHREQTWRQWENWFWFWVYWWALSVRSERGTLRWRRSWEEEEEEEALWLGPGESSSQNRFTCSKNKLHPSTTRIVKRRQSTSGLLFGTIFDILQKTTDFCRIL